MIPKDAQKIITISSIAAPKLDIYSIQNNGTNIHVYDACLIRLFSQVFRLPYKIFLPSDNEVGANLPDGNWTGQIGMVHRSEVDLAVGSAISFARFQAVNLSYPYLFSYLTFMTDKPKLAPTSFTLLHPFPLKLWILLIAAIFLFSCVLFVHEYKKQKYQNILFMLFGSLLEKSIGMQLQKFSLRLIISTWLIFVFVIINSYKAVLLSILTLPRFTGIRDIPGLAKAAERNSVTCYTYKGTTLHQILLESEFPTWRSIGKCLQRDFITSRDAEGAFVKAPSNKAFMTSRTFLRAYEEMYLNSEDSFFNSMYTFPFSRNFCCQSYLNEKIHQLFAAGLFQKIEKDEQLVYKLKASSYDFSEPGRQKILQLDDIKRFFIVLFSGYALSTVALLIEKVVKRYFPK